MLMKIDISSVLGREVMGGELRVVYCLKFIKPHKRVLNCTYIHIKFSVPILNII